MRTSLLLVALLLCSLPIHGAEGPLAALERHYRYLEKGDFEAAREQIQTDNLRPEQLEDLPTVMRALSDQLTQGGGFAGIKVTQQTTGQTERVIIGKLLLHNGTQFPNAWKMALSGGTWKTVYSQQLMQRHSKGSQSP